MAHVPLLGLFSDSPMQALTGFAAIPFAHARNNKSQRAGSTFVDKPVKAKASITRHVEVPKCIKRTYHALIRKKTGGNDLSKVTETKEIIAKETRKETSGFELPRWAMSLFSCFGASGVLDDASDTAAPINLPGSDLASTSGREHAVFDAAPMSAPAFSRCGSPARPITPHIPSTPFPEGDVDAIISLKARPHQSNSEGYSKAQLLKLRERPEGYVDFTPEAREACLQRAKLRQQEQQRELAERTAAADAMVRARVQGGGCCFEELETGGASFFGAMSGGEELGGFSDEEELGGCSNDDDQQEELQGDDEDLDAFENCDEWNTSAPWTANGEDLIAAGREQFLAEQEAAAAALEAAFFAKMEAMEAAMSKGN